MMPNTGGVAPQMPNYLARAIKRIPQKYLSEAPHQRHIHVAHTPRSTTECLPAHR